MTSHQQDALNKALSLQFGVVKGQPLTAWENSFLDDIRKRAEKYGEKTTISEKQSAIIERIVSKIH